MPQPVVEATGAPDRYAMAKRQFLMKGVALATVSGMAYGLYSAFVTRAMGQGVWANWYDGKAMLSAFAIVYILGVLGSGINDLVSAVWAIGIAVARGKLVDIWRTMRTKPGLVIAVCAVIGGPIASAAYIIALQLAGSTVAPITALCPAIGALLSRLLFKQKLTRRMLFGIAICLVAATMIAWSSFQGGTSSRAVLGCAIAFVAALGWAVEGTVAGVSTAVVDFQVGIAIRQATSGMVNLAVVFPLVCLVGGDLGLAPHLVQAALTSASAMPFFLVSGLFAVGAYGLWYKGNSMCGTALGMACNGAYSFWVPFFCWLVLGVVFGQPGWAPPPIVWTAAVVMAVGIVVIAVNPLARWCSRPRRAGMAA